MPVSGAHAHFNTGDPSRTRPSQASDRQFAAANLLAGRRLRDQSSDPLQRTPGCRPLVGATVDVWHCDAQGLYSDVSERRFRTLSSRFLRGYQVTDGSGSVRFVTIYPGWYPGRTVHIHLKIRTGPNVARGLQWTSQLYFDDTITDQAHRHVAYPQREGPRTRNGEDDIFRDGGRNLMLALSGATEGYDARFSIGLKLPS